MIIIMNFQMESLLTYTIVFILLLMTYEVPIIQNNFNEFVSYLFFQNFDRNKNYKDPNSFYQKDLKFKEISDINRFKLKIKGKKRSLMGKWEFLNRKLAKLQR